MRYILTVILTVLFMAAIFADEKKYTLENVGTTPLLRGIETNINFTFADGQGRRMPSAEEQKMLDEAGIKINDLITPIGQSVCSIGLGSDLENIPIFVQGGDADIYTGSYIGLRSPDDSLFATIEIGGLALPDNAKSKGFIFSADRALSFMDNNSSINCAFEISFIDVNGVVVATLTAQKINDRNEMRLGSGFFVRRTFKTITENTDSTTHRYGFFQQIPELERYFQLNDTPLTILFYEGIISVSAGGKIAETSAAVGDYQRIDKILFKVGDFDNPLSAKSCLILLEPKFDQIL